MSSVMLVCAVVASLGAGVALAQAICTGLFLLFRMHARQAAQARLTQVKATPGVS